MPAEIVHMSDPCSGAAQSPGPRRAISIRNAGHTSQRVDHRGSPPRSPDPSLSRRIKPDGYRQRPLRTTCPEQLPACLRRGTGGD